jgi:hypothetical protein
MATDLSERLQAAALSLAGPGPIKDRLFEAYCTYLQDIQESDLPCLGQEFAEMSLALHRERPLPGDHVVRASVRKLSAKEVCYYAELVVRLYGTLAAIKHQFSSTRGSRHENAAKNVSNGAAAALSSAAA